MASYYCSPRANWFENMTDEERKQMTMCAPVPTFRAYTVTLGGTALVPPAPAAVISDADIERIARRVVEMLRASKEAP